MARISMKATLRAPAGEVWKTIRDFGCVGEYVAGIIQTRTQGSGVGALRTLTFQTGTSVVERLETLDDSLRALSYSVLETPLPMKGYIARMKIRDLKENQCELLWESSFQAEGAEEARVKKIIQRLYSFGFEGLKKLHEKESV